MLLIILEYALKCSKREQMAIIKAIKRDDIELFFNILYNIVLGNIKVKSASLLGVYKKQLKAVLSKRKSLKSRIKELLDNYGFLCACMRAVMHSLRLKYGT